MNERPELPIHDVAIEVLQRHDGPMTVRDITNTILTADLYPFGWLYPGAEPVKVVGDTLLRYSKRPNDAIRKVDRGMYELRTRH